METVQDGGLIEKALRGAPILFVQENLLKSPKIYINISQIARKIS